MSSLKKFHSFEISKTPAIHSFIETCHQLQLTSQCDSITRLLKENRNKSSIDLNLLEQAVVIYNSQNSEKIIIQSLLEDSEVLHQAPIQHIEASEIEQIRLQSQERAYQSLIKESSATAQTTEHGFASARMELAIGTNILLGIPLLAYGGYCLLTIANIGTFTQKLIFGLILSIVGLFVEVILILIRDSRKQRVTEKSSTSKKLMHPLQPKSQVPSSSHSSQLTTLSNAKKLKNTNGAVQSFSSTTQENIARQRKRIVSQKWEK